VERAVRAVPGVTGARVEITFDPPWDRCRMSDAAKLKLGLL
jgi:metal-sulfur cluster biosynthetic enzyme